MIFSSHSKNQENEIKGHTCSWMLCVQCLQVVQVTDAPSPGELLQAVEDAVQAQRGLDELQKESGWRKKKFTGDKCKGLYRGRNNQLCKCRTRSLGSCSIDTWSREVFRYNLPQFLVWCCLFIYLFNYLFFKGKK